MSDDAAADPAPSDGPDFEGLLLRSGFNFHVFLAAAFGFARERGATPDEFVAWVAQRLGDTWRALRGHGADAVLSLLLENLASTGYAVLDTQFAADQSYATVKAIPLGLDAAQWRQLLEPFSVTPDDMHRLFRVFVPLVQSAGASLDLLGMRDTLRLTVTRAPNDA